MSDRFLNIRMPESEKQRFKAWVNSLDRETNYKVRGHLVNSILVMERRAKMFAPVNKVKGQGGYLRSTIHSIISDGGMGGSVYTNTKYAPYQEFGTGTGAAVFVPTLEPELQTYAATFKGKGIRRVNMGSQPYLFPAWRLAVKELKSKLKDMGFEEK